MLPAVKWVAFGGESPSPAPWCGAGCVRGVLWLELYGPPERLGAAGALPSGRPGDRVLDAVGTPVPGVHVSGYTGVLDAMGTLVPGVHVSAPEHTREPGCELGAHTVGMPALLISCVLVFAYGVGVPGSASSLPVSLCSCCGVSQVYGAGPRPGRLLPMGSNRRRCAWRGCRWQSRTCARRQGQRTPPLALCAQPLLLGSHDRKLFRTRRGAAGCPTPRCSTSALPTPWYAAPVPWGCCPHAWYAV